MKIALHNSNCVFFREWLAYCESMKYNYKVVNCYDNNIIEELNCCNVLLWHHDHGNPKDVLFAKQLLFSLEHLGIKVFPNFKSGWHFDDKLAQKYLFEIAAIPHIKSYVFYDKKTAIDWVNKSEFPKVFKLRRGCSARNVVLIREKKVAINHVNKAFSSGFRLYNPWAALKDGLYKFSKRKYNLKSLAKDFAHLIYPIRLEKSLGKEKGYIYFQDFMPGNEFDVRVIVVKNRAYGMKRMVRKNDFRASGSSNFVYDPIDEEILKIAFKTSIVLDLQSVAFDFVYDYEKKPVIIEISYGFGTVGSSKCKGYYNEKLEWIEGPFNPFGWMIENIINER